MSRNYPVKETPTLSDLPLIWDETNSSWKRTPFSKIQTLLNSVVEPLEVENIAELRTISGDETGEIAFVQGYYTRGDGGGGPIRYWDSSSILNDNGGSVIKPTAVTGAGRWLWEHSGAVNVKWFGAKGDGVTDNTDTFIVAFTVLGKGYDGYLPEGIYLINNTIEWNIEVSFNINLSPLAIIKGSSSFPTDRKLIHPSVSSGVTEVPFKWVGGKLDGSLRPARSTGAPDLLYINDTNHQNVTIKDVWFYSNEDRSGTSGDSCLFIAQGSNYYVSDCLFQGAVDSGIYVSGDGTETTGRRCIIISNIFKECVAGVDTKRSFEDHVISNNILIDSEIGIKTGDADGTLLPGKNLVVSSNVLTRVKRGIQITQSNGAVISNNRIEDWGITSGGGAASDPGIWLEGSSDCIVSDNILIINSFTPSVSSEAISLTNWTYDSIIYPCNRSVITSNHIEGGGGGIFEGSSDVDESLIQFNSLTNIIGTEYQINGPLTRLIVSESDNTGTPLTLINGWSNAGTTVSEYFEHLGVLYLSLRLRGDLSTDTHIATLPSGKRPKFNCRFVLWGTGNVPVSGLVTTAGLIIVSSSLAEILACQSFPISKPT